ncbi:MAG: hypothetical protein R3253_02670 [Longimicrobiales bacterium]|nr:hypothetical protein [Longimicrobiales bacterium]
MSRTMTIYTTAPPSMDYPDTVDHGEAGRMGRERKVVVRRVTGRKAQMELYHAFFSADGERFELAADEKSWRLLIKRRIVFPSRRAA